VYTLQSSEMPIGPFGSSTQVQHINGTSKVRYQLPQLKQAYQAISGSTRETCTAEGCSGPYQATAHVLINDGKKGGGVGASWWLVPCCTAHNLSANQLMECNPSTVFVAVEEVRSYLG
jgi:hypothetical protein